MSANHGLHPGAAVRNTPIIFYHTFFVDATITHKVGCCIKVSFHRSVSVTKSAHTSSVSISPPHKMKTKIHPKRRESLVLVDATGTIARGIALYTHRGNIQCKGSAGKEGRGGAGSADSTVTSNDAFYEANSLGDTYRFV